MRVLPVSLFEGRDFRFLTLATLFNSVGMMGDTVALGWLALELTNSPLMVGVAMGARSLPLLVVGVPAGVLADRVSRRHLMMLTGAGQALSSGTLGILALLGHITLPHLVVFTLLSGTIRGVEQAARQSYAHDLVGPTGLLDGLAALGLSTRVGWLFGSLAVGSLLGRGGAGVAYLTVAAAYLVGVAVLGRVRAAPRLGASAEGSAWESLMGFARAVRRSPVLPALIALTAGGEILGFSHQTLLPSLARDVLGVGATGLGAMTAARSLGGILGILATSAFGPLPASGALFLAILAGFGAVLVVLGFAPSLVGLAGVLVILTIVNAAGALSDILSQSLMQLAVPADLRGRAGGAWVVAIGLAPLGQVQIGALASLFGVGIALGTSGAALLLLAGLGALLVPRLRAL